MKSAWLVAVATVLVVALVALATLQMRWIADLAAADEQRQRDAEEFAARHFADDVDRQLSRLRSDFSDMSVGDLPQRYAEQSTNLLGAAYAIHARPDEPSSIERFDPATSRLVPIEWPPDLADVRRNARPGGAHPPLIEEVPAFLLPIRPSPPPRMRDEPPPRMRDEPPPRDAPPPPRREPMGPGPMFIALTIDRNALLNVFADCAKRDAEGYDVAIADDGAIVFRSTNAWPKSAADEGEFVRPVLSMRPPDAGGPPPRWRLMLRRHGAAMADVVAAARRRNIAVSFAVLAVLIGAFVLLAVLTRRAEKLRQQQLAFVAGITHELNTPIAAIESAGENLADGIVTDRERVVRYGEAIVKESRRLADIVAQVLTYAGMQARTTRSHEVLDVASLVDSAVAACAWTAEQSGVTIETNLAPNLPPVDGNREELISAIRNLVVNAVRHGGEGRWVGVRAAAERDGVVITVEDRGRGVAPRDLPRLFEAFYRGRNAHARGAGLGLAIVKQIAVAHGGSVSAEKRRDRGAAFVLRLPAPAVPHA